MPHVIYLSGVFLLFGSFSLLLHYLKARGSGEQLCRMQTPRACGRSLLGQGTAQLRQPLQEHLVPALPALSSLMQPLPARI